MADLSEVINALVSAKRPLIVGHITPDTDALGAMLSLARVLPSADVAIALPEIPASKKLRFMLELAGDVPIADDQRLAETDAVIVVDTAVTKRVHIAGKWEAITDKFTINIDHHISNTDFGRINWVVDNASSTCELICRLIQAAGWPLDKTSATLLYAGIYADTGGFSLPNASAETFDNVAVLARAGADIELVGTRLCRSQETHEFDLIRTVYHNTRLASDGRIAYSTLTFEEITAAGCAPDDIDDQVSIPRSLSGVKIAILFSEAVQGEIRINLRGEDGTEVLSLSQELGGGGHNFAAGARIKGQISEVVERVLAQASRAVQDLP